VNDPLTHGEFQKWVDEHFKPHCDLENEHHAQVRRITLGAFGDGNGNTGAFNDVKNLVTMQRRIDAWLDLMRYLWKALGSVAAVGVAWFILAERMGWLK
jgi:hypothetical protein